MEDDRPTPYPLRMPPELRAELERRADVNGRSLNMEILETLKESFGGDTIRQRLHSMELKQNEILDLLKDSKPD